MPRRARDVGAAGGSREVPRGGGAEPEPAGGEAARALSQCCTFDSRKLGLD